MKSLKLATNAIAILSMTACTQIGKNIPVKVQEAFIKKFPAAKEVEWEKESKTEWEAEFKLEGKVYSSNFLIDGTWKKTEHEIKESVSPIAVNKTLESEFAGYEKGEVEISETVERKVYEIELKKGETDMEVAIDASGKIVKMEVTEEDND